MSTPKSHGFLECDGHRILYYVSTRYSAGVKRRVYVYRDLSTGNENRVQELKLAALPVKPPHPSPRTAGVVVVDADAYKTRQQTRRINRTPETKGRGA